MEEGGPFVTVADLLVVLKDQTLLCFHHLLDVAADRYRLTHNLDEFARNCNRATQGMMNMENIICLVRDIMHHHPPPPSLLLPPLPPSSLLPPPLPSVLHSAPHDRSVSPPP